MRFIDYIKKLVSHICVWFTLIEFAILIITQGFISKGTTSDMLVSFLNLKGAAYILLAVLLFELSGLVLRIKVLPRAALNIIHFVICVFCAFLVFNVIPGIYGISYTVVVFAIFAVVYVVLRLAAWGFEVLFEKADARDTNGSIFDEK